MNLARKRRRFQRWCRYDDRLNKLSYASRISPGLIRARHIYLTELRRRQERNRTWRIVEHAPRWEPADLPINAAGDTRPGFVCVHQLENGNGQCGGNVFRVEDEVGNHTCIVHKEETS